MHFDGKNGIMERKLSDLGGTMKFISLLMWVGQFGFSAIFPTVFFLLIAVWLQNKFGFGMWIVAVFGVLGVLTSISTTQPACKTRRIL